jgi:Amt family ammonium transporter
MLVSTAFIFLMVAGYTLYESGQMRRKNATFPLMKNLAITCIAIMAWWLTGYGFAWGAPTKFIGSDGWAFASKGFEKVPVDNYVLWDYELAYLLIACTFFSGSMGERTRLIAYIGWVFLFAFFVYPVVVAWGWAGGWLVRRGYHDYAGSGIVFLAAGTAGFWGSVLLGERYGRKQYREAINKHIDHRIIERVVQERPVCE